MAGVRIRIDQQGLVLEHAMIKKMK